jgi:hypothetical protein|tara:strand:+ start:8305 stop:8640 length:336 start_codon:yes stop_codon:yes gene_type:complete
MKMYNNGQRPQKMYGGGMAMPRKPMMLGGLAEQNKNQGAMSAKTRDAMGMMTQQKKFGMGYNLGGAIKKFEKKSNGGKLTGKNKELAAMYGNPNEITQGDIITAAKKKKPS